MTQPVTFDRVLEVDPPLGDEQLRQVPGGRGVLLLEDEDANPIILLTAANLRARTRGRLDEPEPDQRTRRADLRAVTRRLRWKRAFSHFEADWVYLELARRHWPGRYAEMLSFKPAWFVHTDPSEEHPHFRVRRDVFTARGEFLGPMPTRRAAGQFVEALQDGFDLCRNLQCLRQAPHAPPCPYAQMGRCLQVCDGTISLPEYRRVVARALAFARGEREGVRRELTEQMQTAAQELAFEQAARIKAKLEQLDELEKSDFAHVRPADDFAFVLVQPGRGRRACRTFLVDRGVIEAGPELGDPPPAEQIDRIESRMSSLRERPEPCPDEAGRWRVGLVARYLFVSARQRGLILRWPEEVRGGLLAGAIEAGREQLRLRAPRPPKRGDGGEGSKRAPSTG